VKIRAPSGNPARDRDSECEEAIANPLATLIELAEDSGWNIDEVSNAILSNIQQQLSDRTSDLDLVISNPPPKPANDG